VSAAVGKVLLELQCELLGIVERVGVVTVDEVLGFGEVVGAFVAVARERGVAPLAVRLLGVRSALLRSVD
jgi:hypothetical protein